MSVRSQKYPLNENEDHENSIFPKFPTCFHAHRTASCVITIIAVLAALIFPVFSRAREQGRSTVCLSNIRQTGASLHLYLQDYDETYPMNRFPDEKHPEGKCALVGNAPYPISTSEDSRINWRRVIQPYLKSKQAMTCPSNPYLNNSIYPGYPPGDQTNRFYTQKDYLPQSYAYNGNFFHEAVPSCLYKEAKDRQRRISEISTPTNLIFLLDSRFPSPDLGSWISSIGTDPQGRGFYQSHNGQITLLFADLHIKRMKFAATCTGKMWTDAFPDGSSACKDLSRLPDEYK